MQKFFTRQFEIYLQTRIALLQLRQYNPNEIRCFIDRKAELGSGAFGIVRCSAHRFLGSIAVKCFPVTGGDAEKEIIANV